MMRTARALPLALLLAAASAHGEGPAAPVGAAAKVHDHTAYVFRAPDGPRPPSARAAEAAQNLGAVIDDEVPGDISVAVGPDAAEVRVGDRPLFRLLPIDAQIDGAGSLAEYAPRVQAQLQTFLSKERRRAHLQRGVLGVSLAVFFAMLVYILLRTLYRATRAWEERLQSASEQLSPRLTQLGISTDRSRGLILFSLTALRLGATVGAVYLCLLLCLSLFESTRSWRDQLALWAAAPFRALFGRLVHGLPNLLLLLLLGAVLRAGWRAMTLHFDRVARERAGVPAARVVPYRLLARAALVVGTLVLLPSLLGGELGLFGTIGLGLCAVIGLATVPLVGSVAVGVHALLTDAYALGEWLVIRLPGGKVIAGEVSRVDFTHLRLVPEEGGEIRVPHLLTVWSAVDHRPSTRALQVEITVGLNTLSPRQAFNVLSEASTRVSQTLGVDGSPSVELLEVGVVEARFRVSIPEAPEGARTALLLALSDATGGRA